MVYNSCVWKRGYLISQKIKSHPAAEEYYPQAWSKQEFLKTTQDVNYPLKQKSLAVVMGILDMLYTTDVAIVLIKS